ncbi:MAG: SDR family oxidoreductase [Novosphingobium sp.]|nr:SDR family oxidoreductase [Novosphingobium sp.]
MKAEVPHLSRSVEGRVLFLTGAASGIGRATAHVFAREGARVALSDIDEEGARAVAAEIAAKGGEAHAYALDVTDGDAILDTVELVATDFGGIDYLVNNAGAARLTALDAPDFDDIWDWQINVLLTAHQRAVRAALPHLRTSNAARIVNIASTEAFGATARNSAYVAAKHGVAGLTKALAVDLGKEGITVNAICPGPVLTGLTEKIPENDRNTFAHRRTALRRYADPVEIAHMILSLCLPAASYVTGAVIPVDGGMIARNA